MKIILKIFNSLILISSIGGCDLSQLPPDQLEFKNKIETLQTEYGLAKNNGNSALKQQIEETAVILMHNTPYQAVEWVAEVDSVSDDLFSVSTKSAPYTFHLKFFAPEAVALAKSLKKGDKIKFSGNIGTEKSGTIDEGINNPQFRFYPENVKTYDANNFAVQDINITSDPAAIKKLQDVARCRLDLECWAGRHFTAATTHCQKPIENLAKYNHKWTNGVSEPKFSQHKWFDVEKLYISYLGDKITLQNGHGNWDNQKYSCVFDTLNNTVIKVGVLHGSL